MSLSSKSIWEECPSPSLAMFALSMTSHLDRKHGMSHKVQVSFGRQGQYMLMEIMSDASILTTLVSMTDYKVTRQRCNACASDSVEALTQQCTMQSSKTKLAILCLCTREVHKHASTYRQSAMQQPKNLN